MDCIHLKGIRAYGYTGALAEEQVLGQWFEVELRLWLDLTLSGQTDRLDDTLDYRQVITQVQELIQTAKFTLIEKLASAIADRLLSLESIQQLDIRLTKVAPPIPNFSGTVTIELQRSKLAPSPSPHRDQQGLPQA